MQKGPSKKLSLIFTYTHLHETVIGCRCCKNIYFYTFFFNFYSCVKNSLTLCSMWEFKNLISHSPNFLALLLHLLLHCIARLCYFNFYLFFIFLIFFSFSLPINLLLITSIFFQYINSLFIHYTHSNLKLLLLLLLPSFFTPCHY